MKRLMMIAVLAMMLMVPQMATAGQGETIRVDVNGMVCDFCAQSLKKVFLKEPEVQDIEISLEKKQVVIDLKEGKSMQDKRIETLIINAGYAVAAIHHDKETKNAKK